MSEVCPIQLDGVASTVGPNIQKSVSQSICQADTSITNPPFKSRLVVKRANVAQQAESLTGLSTIPGPAVPLLCKSQSSLSQSEAKVQLLDSDSGSGIPQLPPPREPVSLSKGIPLIRGLPLLPLGDRLSRKDARIYENPSVSKMSKSDARTSHDRKKVIHGSQTGKVWTGKQCKYRVAVDFDSLKQKPNTYRRTEVLASIVTDTSPEDMVVLLESVGIIKDFIGRKCTCSWQTQHHYHIWLYGPNGQRWLVPIANKFPKIAFATSKTDQLKYWMHAIANGTGKWISNGGSRFNQAAVDAILLGDPVTFRLRGCHSEQTFEAEDETGDKINVAFDVNGSQTAVSSTATTATKPASTNTETTIRAEARAQEVANLQVAIKAKYAELAALRVRQDMDEDVDSEMEQLETDLDVLTDRENDLIAEEEAEGDDGLLERDELPLPKVS